MGQDRVGAGPEVGRTYQEVEGPVVVYLEAGSAHVEAADRTAMHAHGEAETTADVWPIRRLHPCGVVAAMPGHRSLALCNALFHTAGGDHRDDLHLGRSLAEFGRNIQRITDLRPVAPTELEDVHPEFGGDVLHVRFEGE